MIIKEQLRTDSTLFTIQVPILSEFLSLQVQYGIPFIFISAESADKEDMCIYCLCTGDSIPSDAHKYLGTCTIEHDTVHYFVKG